MIQISAEIYVIPLSSSMQMSGQDMKADYEWSLP